jgi:hypothetical protein
MMRSYLATTSPTRTFPSLTYILNNNNVPPTTYTGTSPTGAICTSGTCITAEFLSSIARTMPFQVTVRDNRSGGGGITSVQASVLVDAASGPFKVTAQDSFFAPNWQVGSTQTVTWNVANTTAAPVSATNVDIHLSIDGGQTFPFALATNTPNDGTQNIVVPTGTATSQARLRVMGSGNIFFDISNVNFTIVPTTAAGVAVSGRVITANGTGVRDAILTLTNSDGGTRMARSNSFGYYRFDDVASGQVYVLSINSKGHTFNPPTIVLNVNDEITGADFVADPL